MAKVKLSTGREVDTDKILTHRNLGPYVEIQMKTGDERVTDDINVSFDDWKMIADAREQKAEQAAQAGA
jgi:hypothetical protein